MGYPPSYSHLKISQIALFNPQFREIDPKNGQINKGRIDRNQETSERGRRKTREIRANYLVVHRSSGVSSAPFLT